MLAPSWPPRLVLEGRRRWFVDAKEDIRDTPRGRPTAPVALFKVYLADQIWVIGCQRWIVTSATRYTIIVHTCTYPSPRPPPSQMAQVMGKSKSIELCYRVVQGFPTGLLEGYPLRGVAVLPLALLLGTCVYIFRLGFRSLSDTTFWSRFSLSGLSIYPSLCI